MKPAIAALTALIPVGLLAGCAFAPPTPPPPADDPVMEVLAEIDAYRGSYDKKRDLDHAVSDDPTYLALGDRPTTAAVQFSGPICRIRLADVLLTTLKNNRAIQIEDYNRSIAEDGIVAAKGVYDLMIQASYAYEKSKTQTPTRASGASRDGLVADSSRAHAFSLSMGQLVPTGGVFSLFTEYNQNETFGGFQIGDFIGGSVNPFHTIAFGASFVQPLLEGFGPEIVNAPIRIADLQEDVARENFRDQVIQQLVSAVELYWDLVFAVDDYEVKRLSLDRAQELRRVTIIKRDTGVEPHSVVLQAEAEVSRREADLIRARQRIADVEDALKRMMNIVEDSEEWAVNLIPVDRPAVTPYDLNEEAVYLEALQYRPDYRAAIYGRKISEINERVAENRRLPQLDASASWRVTGGEHAFGEAFDEFQTTDFTGWSLGLTFSQPLQNRQARAAHKQAMTRVEQNSEQIAMLEEMIRNEVRVALRSLDTNRRLINAFQASVRAEEAKLDSQIKRYDVGFATVFEVLDFQEDLAEAETNYIEAVINYNKAMIELQRVKASFLQDYRVEFLDKPVQERLEVEDAAGN